MSKLRKNTKYGYFIAPKTTIYRFWQFIPTNNQFLWVFFQFKQVLRQYDVIWRYNWRHLTSFYFKITKKTQNTEILLSQRPQYIDFDSLYPKITDFFGYFYDSSRFWHNTTSCDVIIDVIWRRFRSKLLNQKHKIRRFYCPKDYNMSTLTD